MISSLTQLEPVITLARRAGDAILDVYGRAGGADGIQLKKDETPLTEADERAHRIVTMGLSRITPDIPVISEEGDPPDPAVLEASEAHWLVDPLDGTKEFIKRSGEFTVNLGLVRDGRPVVGVVHAPVMASTWIAVGGLAWRRDRRGDDSILRVRPADTNNLVLAVSRDHSGLKVARLKRKLKGSTPRAMGSSLKFCLLAQGEADLYLRDGRTMEWDTAAAQAVLEAAGGGVYTLDGQPLGYGKPKLQNPKFLAVGDRSVDWLALI